MTAYELAEQLREGSFSAVLFDLDGSLVDSMWMWREIDIEYLGRFGIAMPEDLQSCLGGKSITETALYFRERFGITDPVDVMIRDWNEMAYRKYLEEVRIKPGGGEFLDFAVRNGIALGLCTSNSVLLTDTVLKANGIADLFDVILTGEDIINGKPDPEVYLSAAGRLGISPEKCLVVEDLADGVRAGKAAGMTVLAIRDAHSRGEEEVIRSMADITMDDFTGLTGLINV